jgi:DNA-binding NtrC family response regulator
MVRSQRKQILIVENSPEEANLLVQALNTDEYETQLVSTGKDAVELLRHNPFDILVTNLQLPDMEGSELIREALARYSEIVPIAVTTGENVGAVVEAVRNGASDCILFPLESDQLYRIVRKAFGRRDRHNQNESAQCSVEEQRVSGNIIGESKAMQDIFELVQSIAKSNTSVLITGETGTGKELIAQAIHHTSTRRDHKIISINCGAIPENLLESEFFGHTKGAFTGAHQTRIGRFEQAHNGTLFLDEIGNMSPGLQVKLLRVLQEREFERVGGSEKIKVDVRIIAATSARLAEMVERKEFRMDLYYRLNVVHIEMPPLRERRQDIPRLAKQFVAKFCDLAEIEHKSITQEAMKLLMNCNWLGNVRQLENAIERAIAIMGNRTAIQPSDLPQEVQKSGNQLFLSEIYIPDEGLDFNTQVSAFERQLILESLKKTGGSRCEAAKLLQLKRTTLVEKLKRLNPPVDSVGAVYDRPGF